MVNVKLMAEKLNIAAVYRCIAKEMTTFLEAKTGAVAMIFALAILPLMLVLGVGIDYQRATRARWLMQAAVDAAAITVAKQPSLTRPRATRWPRTSSTPIWASSLITSPV